MTTIFRNTLFDDVFGLTMNDFYFNKSLLKDMHPYEIKTHENKVMIAYQAVGIDKKDVKVSIKKECGKTYLVIEGKTTNKELNKDFSVSGKFVINEPDGIDKVQYDVSNGIVYVYLYHKEYENKIEVEQL